MLAISEVPLNAGHNHGKKAPFPPIREIWNRAYKNLQQTEGDLWRNTFLRSLCSITPHHNWDAWPKAAIQKLLDETFNLADDVVASIRRQRGNPLSKTSTFSYAVLKPKVGGDVLLL